MTSTELFPPDPAEIRRRIAEISSHLGVYAVMPTAENIAPYSSQESKDKVEATLDNLFPRPEWKVDDFNLTQHLTDLRGPFIELAGPTPDGYELANFGEIYQATGKKIMVTNGNPDQLEELKAKMSENELKAMEIVGTLDARKLPFKKGSVGAIFSHSIGYFSSPQLIRQTPDILEQNGLLVAGGFNNLDIAIALNSGLQLVQYSSYVQNWSHGYRDRIWHTVFKNPSKSRNLLPLRPKR